MINLASQNLHCCNTFVTEIQQVTRGHFLVQVSVACMRYPGKSGKLWWCLDTVILCRHYLV